MLASAWLAISQRQRARTGRCSEIARCRSRTVLKQIGPACLLLSASLLLAYLHEGVDETTVKILATRPGAIALKKDAFTLTAVERALIATSSDRWDIAGELLPNLGDGLKDQAAAWA